MIEAPGAKFSKTISTGSSEIDAKMGGGIPSGSLTLVEGQSDSGKSVVVQQMIWGSLHDGATVTLYTSENTVKSFIRQMASLSLDILDFMLLRRLKVLEVSTQRSGLKPEQIFEMLLNSMRADRTSDLIVVDSLTTFVTHTSSEATLAYFEECREICSDGRTVINVANSYAFDNAALARLRSMCDALMCSCHIGVCLKLLNHATQSQFVVNIVPGRQTFIGHVQGFQFAACLLKHLSRAPCDAAKQTGLHPVERQQIVSAIMAGTDNGRQAAP